MRLLDSQAARWLLKPAGRSASLALRLAGRITSYVARELERFAGGDTLSSIADFFAAAAGAAEANHSADAKGLRAAALTGRAICAGHHRRA